MEENKDLFGSAAPEESSDYFADGESLESGLLEESAGTPAPEETAPAADVEAAASDSFDMPEADAMNSVEDTLSDNETADTPVSTVTENMEEVKQSAEIAGQEEDRLAAERAAQEEAKLAAERAAQEEARLAAERAAQEEAKMAAERKAQEEARLAAEKKAQEEARLAEEKKAREEQKAAEKAAKKQAREARRQAWKNWVPGPNVPNQLTIARICMIPLVVVLILWVPKPLGNILSMIVFILACLTDAADGYIARRYNYITTFGKFMDPLADKLLVISAMICLVDLGRLESWIVILIIAREFIISGFRLIAVEKGVVIAANFWGKIKAISQMLMVILMLGNFGGFLSLAAQILKWISLVLTLVSLVTYLIQNRNVLKDNNAS
jgi:CDP-diacylglycerol--glycerol-3-phosphate 3-phosphatidyltransferase